jgi:hypothetical protein
VGVIGDSYNTGVWLDLKPGATVTTFSNAQKPSAGTVWPLASEYHGPLKWVMHHLWLVYSNVFIDKREKAWPALLLEKGSLQQVVNTSESSASWESSVKQIYRLKKQFKGDLPETLILSFQIADICFARQSTIRFEDMKKRQMTRFFNELLLLSKDSSLKKIIWIQQLPVAVSGYDKEVAQNVIDVNSDGDRTCFDLHQDKSRTVFKIQDWTKFYCQDLFFNGEGGVSKVSTLIRSMQKIQKEISDDYLEPFQGLGIELHAELETKKWQIKSNDIGLDCLHLSAKGHASLAEIIQETL